MSGVAVIRYLLANNSSLTNVVPAAKIKAGNLPLNTVMPAISVTQISSIQRLTVAMSESTKMHADRVQVTAYVKDQQGQPQGADYPGLVALIKLILAACPNQHGTVNSVLVDSILPDVEGPDLTADENIITRSRDFIVKWIQ